MGISLLGVSFNHFNIEERFRASKKASHTITWTQTDLGRGKASIKVWVGVCLACPKNSWRAGGTSYGDQDESKGTEKKIKAAVS